LHFFELRNFQHFVLYVFPALVFIFIFWAALAFSYFRTKDSEEKKKRIIEVFIGEIEGRNAPFPLVLILIFVGTVLWLVLYIFFIGLFGVKI
jgi:hypothetical protein